MCPLKRAGSLVLGDAPADSVLKPESARFRWALVESRNVADAPIACGPRLSVTLRPSLRFLRRFFSKKMKVYRRNVFTAPEGVPAAGGRNEPRLWLVLASSKLTRGTNR
jgi:hypothetical protein